MIEIKEFKRFVRYKDAGGYWIAEIQYDVKKDGKIVDIGLTTTIYRQYQGDKWKYIEGGKVVELSFCAEIENGFEAKKLLDKFEKSGGWGNV
jgi:hypothetical protein